MTRCQRADGSFYGTGGKCRLGTEAEARGEAKKLIAYHAKKTAEEAFGDKKLQPEYAALRNSVYGALGAMRNIKEYMEAGLSKEDATVMAIRGSGESLRGLKYEVINSQPFTTESGMRAIWDKANGGKTDFVWEHTVPTKEMVNGLFRKFDGSSSPKDIAEYILRHNVIAVVSKSEDNKLNSAGLRQKSPDDIEKNPFARYDQTDLKVIAVKPLPKYRQNPAAVLSITAKAAIKQGLTYEQWADSVLL